MNLSKLVLVEFILSLSLTIILILESFFFLPILASQLSSTQLGSLSNYLINSFKEYSMPLSVLFFIVSIFYGFMYSKGKIIKWLIILSIILPFIGIVLESAFYVYAIVLTPLYYSIIGIIFWSILISYIAISGVILNYTIKEIKI